MYFNLDDLAQQISDKQNELKKQITAKELIEIEESELSRKILELRIEQKKLNEAIIKASNNQKVISIEIKQLTQQYWNVKNI